MSKFTARTRLRGHIRYFEAEWWVQVNGYATVMFRDGPHRGKAYIGAEVAIARDEKWKLEEAINNGKGTFGVQRSESRH